MRGFQFVLILLLLLNFAPITNAKDIAVKIGVKSKVTTSNPFLKYGDCVEFFVKDDVEKNGKLYIKKGEKVEGSIVELVDNDWYSEAAKVVIENFHSFDVNGKPVVLDGSVVRSGDSHPYFMGGLNQIPILNKLTVFVRGGEVQIKPKKDTFTLFIED